MRCPADVILLLWPGEGSGKKKEGKKEARSPAATCTIKYSFHCGYKGICYLLMKAEEVETRAVMEVVGCDKRNGVRTSGRRKTRWK